MLPPLQERIRPPLPELLNIGITVVEHQPEKLISIFLSLPQNLAGKLCLAHEVPLGFLQVI